MSSLVVKGQVQGRRFINHAMIKKIIIHDDDMYIHTYIIYYNLKENQGTLFWGEKKEGWEWHG